MVRCKPAPSTGKTQTAKKQSAKATLVPSPAQSIRKPTPSSVPSCCSCGVVITEDTKALQCDRCMNHDSWKCAQCLNLTGDLYDCLVSDCNVPLRWFCDGCEKQVLEKKTIVLCLTKMISLTF